MSANACLPLPALLSSALVAFTIEFDNEFEHQMPHRTSDYGSSPGSTHGPWLVSMVMWSKFMQFIPEQGIPVRELQRLTQATHKSLDIWLTRLGKWWGYIVIESGSATGRSKRIGPDALVWPTTAGRRAQQIWRPLFGVIEERWRERFGKDKVARLRESLVALGGRLDPALPDSLPILGYGLFSKPAEEKKPPASTCPDRPAISDLPISALLSRVLLAFAIEFEGESTVSLAICSNVLRLGGEKGVRVRNLPRLSGVSKEAIAMSLSFLEKRGYAVTEPESPGSRVKLLMLTSLGQDAQDTYRRLLTEIEARWQERFGVQAIQSLCESLESLVRNGSAEHSPLFRGLEPYPDNWRASARKPEVLPHYPMVLHRGGFPDGS